MIEPLSELSQIRFESCPSEDIGDAAENEFSIATNAEIVSIRRNLIQRNTSGICQCCKNPIEPARIEFIKGVLHCKACQSDIDSGRRMRPREEMIHEVAEESELTASEEEFATKIIIAGIE